MNPFREFEIGTILANTDSELKKRVSKYTDDEIMANDLDLLASNCYEEFRIDPVDIGEEDISLRKSNRGEVEIPVSRDWEPRGRITHVRREAAIMQFFFPYSGDQDLFRCSASTFSVSPYPCIELHNGFVIFTFHEILDDFNSERLQKRLDSDVADIRRGIGYVNADVAKYNAGLKGRAIKLLSEKRTNIEKFYEASRLMNIPLTINSNAKIMLPITKKRDIRPIAKTYEHEPKHFSILEEHYTSILQTIKHNGSSYERTPSSIKSLGEENLRDVLLAALNGDYQGAAVGEAFRRKGKTDICIEAENRAAFVAECKVWSGANCVEKAVRQLDSYLTWRDCKTALIFFVRRKKFFEVLSNAREALNSCPGLRHIKDYDQNEFEYVYTSESNVGQLNRMRVMLFNLFCE